MKGPLPGYLFVGPDGAKTWVGERGFQKYLGMMRRELIARTGPSDCIVLHQPGEAPNHVASALFGIPVCGMAAQKYKNLREVSPNHTEWAHFTFHVYAGLERIRTVVVIPQQLCTVTHAWHCYGRNQFDGDDRMTNGGVWTITPVMKPDMVRLPTRLLLCGCTLTHFQEWPGTVNLVTVKVETVKGPLKGAVFTARYG
jgi:hypothetical protein